MKTLFYLILLLTASSSFAQQIIKEKIPKGREGAGRIIETEITKDTIWIADKLFDGTNNSVYTISLNDFVADGDTAIYVSKDIPYTVSGRVSLGKWSLSIESLIKSFPEHSKSAKAIRQWQLAIIKEKYPDYYAKWFAKKP